MTGIVDNFNTRRPGPRNDGDAAMAKKDEAKAEGEAAVVETPDSPLLDLSDAAVKRMLKIAKKRGWVTQDELNAVLPSEEISSDQIEDMNSMLSEMGINVVESEDAEEADKESPETADEEEAEGGEIVEAARTTAVATRSSEPAERTDDPVRMYLREMGSVELLSREGEIAIAKRIEAGRDMMIGGLCESPLTFKAIISWHDQLRAGRMLLRDIVDLEATQGAGAPVADGTVAPAPAPAPTEGFEPSDDDDDEGEGPGMSLSALEEKLKPEVLATFEEIEALYKKLHKMQSRRLETMTSGEEVTNRSEKSYERAREELVGKVDQVRLHNNRIEELVTQLKQLNQRLNAMEGQLLRMAEASKVNREDFLKQYRGHELDPNWLERGSQLPSKGWKPFAIKHIGDIA